MADLQLHPTYPVATERLRLRPLTDSDVSDLVAYRSIPDVTRYVPFVPMDAETVRARLKTSWAAAQITAEGDALTLGIELAASGCLVGDIVLFFHSARHRSGEIGWVLHPDYSGHGYATEAAAAVLSLAFDGLGLHRVSAHVDARNDASARLCERLGMRREAHLLQNEWFKGEWSDELTYALLEHEWSGRGPSR